jgi:hypothetical protein
VSPSDLKQISADVNRNVHFHPFVRTTEFQKMCTRVLQMLCVDHSYVQGLDTICILILLQYKNSKRSYAALPLIRQIYARYLKPFISPSDQNLSFNQAALVVQRLCYFYMPDL